MLKTAEGKAQTLSEELNGGQDRSKGKGQLTRKWPVAKPRGGRLGKITRPLPSRNKLFLKVGDPPAPGRGRGRVSGRRPPRRRGTPILIRWVLAGPTPKKET